MIIKILRFIPITILKFFVTFFGLFMLYPYILPDWISGNTLTAITWTCIFIITLGFATWALHPYTPRDQDIALLVVVWFFVTLTTLLGYGLFLSSRGPWIILETEIIVQLIIEIIGIVLASLLLRRRKLHQEFAEVSELIQSKD